MSVQYGSIMIMTVSLIFMWATTLSLIRIISIIMLPTVSRGLWPTKREKDVLYHNNGDGTFQDVTEAMGIIDLDGRAMGVGAADYDDDGFVDIFVANDHTLNYLWHNEGGKRFTDRGTMSGTAFSQAGEATVSMSVDFADYNDDGLLDLFVSDDTYCSLYENLGNGMFSDKGHVFRYFDAGCPVCRLVFILCRL